jgi:EAL domain-containing protein (putative c-di-GMP-specific phosphodiesterase class I)/ActR/RegA family two-component response regulator
VGQPIFKHGDRVTQPEPQPASSGRVLLVDDEAAILRVFRRYLERHGFSVVTAEDGQAAGHKLVESQFDVVLTDIAMPNATGLDLLRMVRQRDPDLPVLLMTANPTVDTATQAIPFGILGYLSKPVVLTEMLSVVRRAVQIHRLAKVKREALDYLNSSGADWIEDRSGLEGHFTSALATAWMAYQPIVSVSDRRIVAYEALVRPRHPMLPNPLALIRAAEQLGRVHQMGRCLRDMVAARVAQDADGPDVFVNLHGLDLGDDALLAADAPLTALAKRVVLEITERASLDHIADLDARIRRLRSFGFRIALDDLGAGYSGLTLFAQLQPEIVKIDMSLVRNIDRIQVKRRLVRSMIDVCSDMSMRVVCEGVETAAERDTLIDLGADLIQGYFFARPGEAYPGVTDPDVAFGGVAASSANHANR